jgi:hypothetical protein
MMRQLVVEMAKKETKKTASKAVKKMVEKKTVPAKKTVAKKTPIVKKMVPKKPVQKTITLELPVNSKGFVEFDLDVLPLPGVDFSYVACENSSNGTRYARHIMMSIKKVTYKRSPGFERKW